MLRLACSTCGLERQSCRYTYSLAAFPLVFLAENDAPVDSRFGIRPVVTNQITDFILHSHAGHDALVDLLAEHSTIELCRRPGFSARIPE